EASAHCFVNDEDSAPPKPEELAKLSAQRKGITPQASDGNLHTYRLAIAATGEYTAAQGGTVASALSAITTTINGVNAIYAQEISVRLTLIGNENSIIYTDGTTDPYTSGNLNSLIGENQSNLQSVIGDDNYDLGQVFDGPNVGGLANIGGVCDNARKGKGASTGNFVDITAHELGHQLGAHHIFNSTSGFCGNFNGGSQRN